MEIIELLDHPYFVGVQYHPEFKSRPFNASPPFVGLMLASSGKLEQWIKDKSKARENAKSN
jgi:CTP synthase